MPEPAMLFKVLDKQGRSCHGGEAERDWQEARFLYYLQGGQPDAY